MPVIKSYEQRIRNPGPVGGERLSAQDVGAATGSAVAQLGRDVSSAAGVINQRLEQEDVSRLNSLLSKASAEIAVEAKERVASTPIESYETIDTSFKDFQKGVDDRISKIGEQISTAAGRKYFDDVSTDIKMRALQLSFAGQADLKSYKSAKDFESSVFNLANAAKADPTSYELQKNLLQKNIDTLVASKLISQVDGDKLKQSGEETLAKSTLRGWAELEPELAKAKLNGGAFDDVLNPDAKRTILREIETAESAKEIEALRLEKLHEKKLEAEREVTKNTFLQKLSEGNLSTKEVLSSNLTAFGGGSKDQFLKLMKREQQSGPPKTDKSVYIDLFKRINAPESDPKKIRSSDELEYWMAQGRLSYESLQQLRRELQGDGTVEGQIEKDLKGQFVKMAGQKIGVSEFGLRNPKGEENLLAFLSYFSNEYARQRQAGKSPTELLTPGSKDYLGNLIPQFQQSQNDILKSMSKSIQDRSVSPGDAQGQQNQATLTPRKEGESPKEYLDRIKKEKGEK